jgi:uncharacterized membrane protein
MNTLSMRNLMRQLSARPRLVASALIGGTVILLLPLLTPMHLATRLIIGWNVGACLYLMLAGVMMTRSTRERMLQRASAEDEGQGMILALVILAAITCLMTIVVELGVVKAMPNGAQRSGHIALAVLTIASAWAFTHVMFALHYAHDFYAARSKSLPGGLAFPSDTKDSKDENTKNKDEPEYGDFLYFAFVIGTSGQTADVSFTSKPMRRIGLVHCVLAFVFNTTVLALTINIAASLI